MRTTVRPDSRCGEAVRGRKEKEYKKSPPKRVGSINGAGAPEHTTEGTQIRMLKAQDLKENVTSVKMGVSEYPEAQRSKCVHAGNIENGCFDSFLDHLEQLIFDQDHDKGLLKFVK